MADGARRSFDAATELENGAIETNRAKSARLQLGRLVLHVRAEGDELILTPLEDVRVGLRDGSVVIASQPFYRTRSGSA